MLRSVSRKLNLIKLSGVIQRSFGSAHGVGNGHAHAVGPAGPYDVPHHPTYPDKAYLFGINPNEKYKYEGWEGITAFTYIIVTGMILYSAFTQPVDSFKVKFFYFLYIYHLSSFLSVQLWARNEAIARQKIRESGGEIEFGKFYSTPVKAVYEENDGDKRPRLKEQ